MRLLIAIAMLGGAAVADEWDEPHCDDAEVRAWQSMVDSAPDAAHREHWQQTLNGARKRLANCEAKAAPFRKMKQDKARAAAERARAASDEADKVNADPRTPQIAWSALLCGWLDDRAEAMNEIKQYRKAAKIGGVINLTEINNWQEEVMRADRHVNSARAALKQLKAKPLTCKDPTVAKISPCMTDDARGPGECDGADPYRKIARGDE